MEAGKECVICFDVARPPTRRCPQCSALYCHTCIAQALSRYENGRLQHFKCSCGEIYRNYRAFNRDTDADAVCTTFPRCSQELPSDPRVQIANFRKVRSILQDLPLKSSPTHSLVMLQAQRPMGDEAEDPMDEAGPEAGHHMETEEVQRFLNHWRPLVTPHDLS